MNWYKITEKKQIKQNQEKDQEKSQPQITHPLEQRKSAQKI